MYSLWIMSAFYILAGLNHFRSPHFYSQIIPPYLPFPKIINAVSGIVEVILGALLLFPQTQSLAAAGIVALLVAIFPANIYHFQLGLKKKKMVWVLALRLPLQLVLIYWASGFV